MSRLPYCTRRWIVRAWIGWLAMVVALAGLIAGPFTAQAASYIPGKNLSLLGVYGGAMNTILVDGGFAYIGQGALLATLSLAKPTQPERLGASGLLPGQVQAIALSQGFAYAALGEAGIAVIDVHDPAHPLLMEVVGTPGSANDLAVAGAFLIVADGGAGLRIYDLGDPSQPTPDGSLDTPGNAQRLVVAVNMVYLADGSGGLRIIDLTTPATPATVGVFDASEEIGGVAYGDNYAYVTDDGYNLRVIDVSDPAQPSQVGVTNTQIYQVLDVVVAGNYLYVRLDVGLYVYDLGPASPQQVATAKASNFVTDMSITGNYAFVTDSRVGLQVVDVTSPTTPADAGLLRSLSQTSGVAVRGTVAYAADDFQGVAVIDSSNPAQMSEKLRIGVESRLDQQVAIAGDTLIQDALYVVLGGENRKLFFYSLANPLAPTAAGSRQVIDNFTSSPRLATHGSFFYVAELEDGLTVLDAEDPTGAALGVYQPPSGLVIGVAALSNEHVVVIGGDHLWYVDVSEPGSPQQIGSQAGIYSAVAGSGDQLFAYNTISKQLEILSIQGASGAHVTADITLPGDRTTQIVVSNNLVWVANGSGGVRVIDLLAPGGPSEVAFFDPPGNVVGLAVDGERAYVAASDLGLLALQFETPTALDETTQPTRWKLVLPLLVN